MLKFNKLAWRGYGVCAVRQLHFGQELSPRGLFPRASAVFLAEADGLGAQSFGCRHSQGQKLLFCLSPTMSVEFSSGGWSGFEEQRAKAISHIGGQRHSKHESSGFSTIFGVQRHTCRDAVGYGVSYLLRRCSCFDVSFAVYSQPMRKTKALAECVLVPRFFVILVMATFQSWLLCMRAGGSFAAFVCAVMATLPQTALGAPAAGIDPTVDELQQIGDVAGIFSWLGSEESLRTAVLRDLGGGQPRLRDLGQPICGRKMCTISGFHKAKLSATLLPWKLVTLEWCDGSHGRAWVSPCKTRWRQLHRPQGGGLGFGGPQPEDASIVSGSLWASLPSHGSSSRFFWTQRWTQSSRAFRRQKYRKCLPTASGCEEQTPPRTSGRPCSKSVLSIR